MAAFDARKNYRMVKKFPQLSQYPYNEKTESAFFITYIGVCMITPRSDPPGGTLLLSMVTTEELTDMT